MNKIDRRSALAIGLGAASSGMMKSAAAQTTGYKDTTPWPGVVVRAYDGETPSLIPGFKTVSMRDVIMQPGSKTMGPPMMNAMICHIPEGELRIEQEGKTFTAKKNFVWTCNKETKEQAYNDGNVVAIMPSGYSDPTPGLLLTTSCKAKGAMCFSQCPGPASHPSATWLRRMRCRGY